MQSFRQLASRGMRARANLALRPYPALSIRQAHQSYGNEQSGMEQGTHEENPKSHLEHPGPEAPANKGTAKKSSSSPNGPSSSSSSSPTQSSDNGSATSRGGSPAIHRPKSAAEDTDPDVKKHNEEMEKRSDRSVNQLSEKDNKVDKKFWQGDVGPKKE